MMSNLKYLNEVFEAKILNSQTIMGYKQYSKRELVDLRLRDSDSGLYNDHYLTCLWLCFLWGGLRSDKI